ncbi:MAG: enhanced serine sensitivity protein SseB [Ruminococcus sp.]|nr:enhanced serine sensitivity protein SseB [Ruminococcus sp.]
MSELTNAKIEGSKIPVEDIKNPDLTAAIETMQTEGTKENIDAMVEEVFKAKFILPAKVTPVTKAVTEHGRTIMQQSTQMQFKLIQNGNKEMFFAIFTDIEELNKWKGTEADSKVVTDFDSVASMVMDPKANVAGFVINPFGKSVAFPKGMVHSIKQLRDFAKIDGNKIEPGAKVQLGDPEEYPIDLMAALINHFTTEPNVNAAFLRLLKQEDGRQSYFIVVDFVGNMQETFDAIKKVADPLLDEDIDLTMMPYSIEFASNAVRGVQPFYTKQR